MSLPPYHEHIGDPAVGDSTHCICHVLRNPPASGCGRVHCVNRKRGMDEADVGETEAPVQNEGQQRAKRSRSGPRWVGFAWLLRLLKRRPR